MTLQPGAAPHGAKAKTGGDGSGRGEAGRLTRARRLAERGFKRAARAGGGGRRTHRPGRARTPGGERGSVPAARACPGPPGAPYPICRVYSEERAAVGAPCTPPQHPDYIYQRVVSPEAPTTPSPVTQSRQDGAFRQGKYDISPPLRLCPGSGPLPPGLPGRSNSHHRPDRGRSGRQAADPGRDARPGITGVLSRCAGHPTPPSPCVFTQVRRGSGFKGSRPRRPGGAGTANPPPPPAPTGPTRSAAPDRPAGLRRRRRCPLAPRPARRRTRLGHRALPLPAPSPPA